MQLPLGKRGLSQAEVSGPIGDLPNMKGLVAAAKLLVQTKIAGGAFALWVARRWRTRSTYKGMSRKAQYS